MQTIQSELQDFIESVQRSIGQWETSGNAKQQVAFGIGDLNSAIGRYLSLLDQAVAVEQLREALRDVSERYSTLRFLYEHNALVKPFFVLWRNTLFELHKGMVFRLEEQVGEDQILELGENAKETLLNAWAEVASVLSSPLNLSEDKMKKQIERWERQDSPSEAVRKQLELVRKQANRLLDEGVFLQKALEVFKGSKSLVLDNVEQCRQQVSTLEQMGNEAVALIRASGQEAPGKVASQLKEFQKRDIYASENAQFNAKLDGWLDQVKKKTNLIVGHEGGNFVVRDIDFQRLMTAFLDSEILPLLYEVWEISSNVSNGLKMTLINVSNRASVLSSNDKNQDPNAISADVFAQPLEFFLQQEKLWKSDLEELRMQLRQRLEKGFWLHPIFQKGKVFLETSFQSNLPQFSFEGNELFSRAGRWVQSKIEKLRSLQEQAVFEDQLSEVERMLRFINSRTMRANNQHYTSIFLTKGYIGESFWVGRDRELERVGRLIEQWGKGGFSSILITGKRLSGKTLFGEMVISRFFLGKAIRISPNSIIEVQGRKKTTSTDLGEALDFVKKHSIAEQGVVWIDDLELWADADLEVSLGRNVRLLRKHLGQNANRNLYLVSVGNWLYRHLTKIYDLDMVFQAEINLDSMNREDVWQAVRLRHGATHKVIVAPKSKESTDSPETAVMEPLSASKFKKNVARLHSLAEGNIGETLNLWAASIQKVDEDYVTFARLPNYSLPDSISPDEALLLSMLMVEKRSNEYRLSKLFGPAYAEKYNAILRRFLNIGLVLRNVDGHLEINELVVNELGRVLHEQ